MKLDQLWPPTPIPYAGKIPDGKVNKLICQILRARVHDKFSKHWNVTRMYASHQPIWHVVTGWHYSVGSRHTHTHTERRFHSQSLSYWFNNNHRYYLILQVCRVHQTVWPVAILDNQITYHHQICCCTYLKKEHSYRPIFHQLPTNRD